MSMQRLLALCLALMITQALAERIEIPLTQQGDQHLPVPQKGQSKTSVLERFGLPDQEHPAIGKPPITRWDYRYFSVYFEYNHVIDSVRHHQKQSEIQP